MLRSLITDPESKLDGQPKLKKDMSPDETHYVDVIAPGRERDLKRTRARFDREAFFEDVRACIERDVTSPKAIAKELGCSEQKVEMTLREMRLLD